MAEIATPSFQEAIQLSDRLRDRHEVPLPIRELTNSLTGSGQGLCRGCHVEVATIAAESVAVVSQREPQLSGSSLICRRPLSSTTPGSPTVAFARCFTVGFRLRPFRKVGHSSLMHRNKATASCVDSDDDSLATLQAAERIYFPTYRCTKIGFSCMIFPSKRAAIHRFVLSDFRRGHHGSSQHDGKGSPDHGPGR